MLQRARKGTIAPKRRLSSVRAPPICSMKLPSWRDSTSLRPLVSARTNKVIPAESRGAAYLSRR